MASQKRKEWRVALVTIPNLKDKLDEFSADGYMVELLTSAGPDTLLVAGYCYVADQPKAAE